MPLGRMNRIYRISSLRSGLEVPVLVAIDGLDVVDLGSVIAEVIRGKGDGGCHREGAEGQLERRAELFGGQRVEPGEIRVAVLFQEAEHLLAGGKLLLGGAPRGVRLDNAGVWKGFA